MRTFQLTHKPNIYSPHWIEMVRYLVDLATLTSSLKDVNRALLTKEPKPGLGYHDFKRTLDALLADGVLLVDDGRLKPGSIKNVSWIDYGLKDGAEDIWDLATLIDPNPKWAKKYDNTELVEIGLKGEEAVVALLHQETDERYHHRIEHVALVDDTLGFDIQAPSIRNHEDTMLLEVKATVRPTKEFTFYLSRNEFNVGTRNPNWSIVCVKIRNGKSDVLGHLKLYQFKGWLPTENSTQVKWQTLKIQIPMSLIIKGLT
jgi:hypothetical protein